MNKTIMFLTICLALFGTSCSIPDPNKEKVHLSPEEKETSEVATFAGGCFWCTESDFEKVKGVKAVISGYSGGEIENPSYKAVAAGKTGHREAVQVYYDSSNVSYEQLLEVFWKHHDPTDEGGSFYDRGHQYTSAIYYHNEEQKKLAEKSLKDINESGVFDKPVVTSIEPLANFYEAEDYHQDYHKKNPIRYNYYRKGSGRDDFIKETWSE